MAARRSDLWALPLAACLLLWPAAWNGYPIVFADSGTYLSQAVHRYAGWDRPVFYSLFILPLHATVSLWPVVAAQALLTAWVLRLACRAVAPDLAGRRFVALVAALAAFTWLPWLVSELMPDIFTPLVVICMALLPRAPGRAVLLPLTAFLIAAQQSSVVLGFVMAGAVGMFARTGRGSGLRPCVMAGARPPAVMAGPGPAMTGRAMTVKAPAVRAMAVGAMAVGARTVRGMIPLALPLAPPALAVLALCAANVLVHGRFAVSPYGNVFLLARVIYDGPGADALRRDCPAAGWRLCPYAGELPPTSDDFLWTPDSPLNRAGGPKAVSAEAGAIIRAAIAAEPLDQAAAALRNTLEQLGRFASGDGLNAWPAQVTPWIERDFPPNEAARYAAARQQAGDLTVPWPLGLLHQVAGLLGVAGCVALLPGALRQRSAAACLLVAVLLALPVSAAVTGALSCPHDRYQARIMWLPPFAAALCLARRRA